MSHLGRWLSALVDGELDGVERDRALNHVAGCQSCRQEANAMRALKRRLTALGQAADEPAIASRLIELARGDQVVPAALRWPMPEGIARLGRPGDFGSRLLTRTWRLAAASACGSLIAIGVIAFLLGNGAAAPPVPQVTPSVDSYLMQHIRDAGQEPAGSVPATGTAPGNLSPWHAGHARARTGRSARDPGHGLVRSASKRTTAVMGTAAASRVGRAAASPTASPAASATASPDASASASNSVGQSPGPYVTSHHRG